ncbi:MAG: ferrochelatase [Bacteroidales bacterium]|jgi:ferrochelatase|nr:ferrochelatase [Bacteroidales bacterium]
MNQEKTAILLMNVGSPDKPTIPSVSKYLIRFLNDKRVIDLPWLLRKFLVNAIIIPFRVRKTTGLYRLLWTKNGSPLIFYSEKLKTKLQTRLGNYFEVFLGMRYGNPSYKSALGEIKNKGFKKIIILPLFPQYAVSTTETSLVAAETEIKKLRIQAKIFKIEQFYNHPKFIDAFVAQVKKNDLEKFNHVIFSYHGLPNRQVEKCHPGIKIENCTCDKSLPENGKLCYRATCYETTRLIADKLNLETEKYSVGFQSRLSVNWLIPFTDEIIQKKLSEGNKNILVIAPSFVTDCLETIFEIGIKYGEEFHKNGGERFKLVESLNAEEKWMETLVEIISAQIKVI